MTTARDSNLIRNADGTAFDAFIGRPDRCVRLCLADMFAIVFLFGGVVLAYFVPPIAGGGVLTPPEGDVALYWIWVRQFLGEALRAGNLPLWNPFMMSGTPFLASNQAAVFYPPNWLHAILPLEPLVNVQMIAHFWFGLAAMHLLLRRLGRSVAGSAAGALVFGFSGFAILHWWAGHLPFVTEWPWTPLAVLAWMKIQRDAVAGTPRGVLAGCIGMSGAFAMQFFSGHPQIVYYTMLIIAGLQTAWLLYALRRRACRRALGGCLVLAGALAISAALVAVQAVPTLRLTATTVRSSASVDQAAVQNYFDSLSQPPWVMLTSVLMRPFGAEHGALGYYGGGSSWEVTAFVGVAAALLALACIVLPRRATPLGWTLLLVAMFAWWLALGRFGGLFRLLFNVLPGLSLFRAPSRMLYIVTFCVGVLSASGFDFLWRLSLEDRAAFLRAVRRLAVVVISCGLIFLVLFARAEQSPLALWVFRQRLVPNPDYPLDENVTRPVFQWFRQSVFVGLGTAAAAMLVMALFTFGRAARLARLLLAGFVLAELAVFALPYRETFRHARQVWPDNLDRTLRGIGQRHRIGSSRHGSDRIQGMLRGVRHVWGYEPTVSYRYSTAMMIAQTEKDEVPDAYLPTPRITPFMRALGTRLYLANPDEPPPEGPGWRLADRSFLWALYEDPFAIERGFTVPRAEQVSPEQVRWMVNRADFEPTRTVLLEEAFPPGFIANGETSVPGTVRFLHDGNELVEAEVEMLSPGWFVLMDQLLPGWSATVDGEPARLYRANATGRALPLGAGKHVVRMTYTAPGLSEGAWISGIAWALWLSAAALFALTSRRRGNRRISC